MSDFENAPCIGKANLIDAVTWRDAAPALNDCCRVCPYRLQCLIEVNPASSWYEGVCGGIVWLNGKPQEKEYSHLHPLHRPYADFEALNEYKNWRNKNDRTADSMP